MAQGGALRDLLVLAGHKQHLERERALGRIEEVLDAAGEAHLRSETCKGCSPKTHMPRELFASVGCRSAAHRIAPVLLSHFCSLCRQC